MLSKKGIPEEGMLEAGVPDRKFPLSHEKYRTGSGYRGILLRHSDQKQHARGGCIRPGHPCRISHRMLRKRIHSCSRPFPVVFLNKFPGTGKHYLRTKILEV